MHGQCAGNGSCRWAICGDGQGRLAFRYAPSALSMTARNSTMSPPSYAIVRVPIFCVLSPARFGAQFRTTTPAALRPRTMQARAQPAGCPGMPHTHHAQLDRQRECTRPAWQRPSIRVHPLCCAAASGDMLQGGMAAQRSACKDTDLSLKNRGALPSPHLRL